MSICSYIQSFFASPTLTLVIHYSYNKAPNKIFDATQVYLMNKIYDATEDPPRINIGSSTKRVSVNQTSRKKKIFTVAIDDGKRSSSRSKRTPRTPRSK